LSNAVSLLHLYHAVFPFPAFPSLVLSIRHLEVWLGPLAI
jgi:hypothetical protein